jgi:hypothetical protein
MPRRPIHKDRDVGRSGGRVVGREFSPTQRLQSRRIERHRTRHVAHRNIDVVKHYSPLAIGLGPRAMLPIPGLNGRQPVRVFWALTRSKLRRSVHNVRRVRTAKIGLERHRNAEPHGPALPPRQGHRPYRSRCGDHRLSGARNQPGRPRCALALRVVALVSSVWGPAIRGSLGSSSPGDSRHHCSSYRRSNQRSRVGLSNPCRSTHTTSRQPNGRSSRR